jgi:eukaryotic-like serine/threonine-protein kinase
MDVQGQVLKGKYGYYRAGKIIGGKKNSRVYSGEVISEPPIPCAIKEIADTFNSESERIRALNRFNNEAETILRLNHPGLVEVMDYFTAGDTHYFFMAFVDGINLESLPAKFRAPLSGREAVEFGIQVCRALYYLHIQKPPVVFANIRPRHIIKMDSQKIKLVEFGLGEYFKPLDPENPYCPPEFSLSEGRINPRSDLYSLGITLYELCTGETPDEEFSKLKNIPIELGVVIEKSAAPDPGMRYKSAKEMKDALMDCLKNPQFGRGR